MKVDSLGTFKLQKVTTPMSKKIIFLFIPVALLLIFIGLYFSFISQVSLLKDHYPVFSVKENSYVLSSKRPEYWLPLKRISKEAQFAIIISEDWAFFEHEGIDINQLKIVIEESIESKELTRGASTITQQVVKNAFLSNERSIFRKLKEFLLAREFEQKFSKEKILEIYLNLIELGDGIYGIKQGSEFYFQKPPAQLNAKEGAFLAMLLPSPIRYSQSFRDKELTDFAKERVDGILMKLKQAKIITESERIGYSYEKLAFETTYAADYFEFSPAEKENLDEAIQKDF